PATSAAAAGELTVIRTSSEPARASSLTWMAAATGSAVSVFVIHCTTTAASPPTRTSRAPQRTRLWRERGRGDGPTGRGTAPWPASEAAVTAAVMMIAASRQRESGNALATAAGQIDRLTSALEPHVRRVADPQRQRPPAAQAAFTA